MKRIITLFVLLNASAFMGNLLFAKESMGSPSGCRQKVNNTHEQKAPKRFKLKVSRNMPPSIQKMFNGKKVKQGNNKFIIDDGYSVNFVVDNGRIIKCVIVTGDENNPSIVDMLRDSSPSGTSPDPCNKARMACWNACKNPVSKPPATSSTSGTDDSKKCKGKCEVEWQLCMLKSGLPKGAIILQ